jgi:hypothetical protein
VKERRSAGQTSREEKDKILRRRRTRTTTSRKKRRNRDGTAVEMMTPVVFPPVFHTVNKIKYL